MNNRLTLQDLAGILADLMGRERSDMEQFLREFVIVVSESVCKDKIVKVKGLGTFKVIRVEERESINVNTGERFMIPAHYKFSFLPDSELREQVNKPFSFFETTELNENVDFSGMEISDDSEKKENEEDESIEDVTPEPTILTGSFSQKEPVKEEIVENKQDPESIKGVGGNASEEEEGSIDITDQSLENKELPLQPEPIAEPSGKSAEPVSPPCIVPPVEATYLKRKNRLKWIVGGTVFVLLIVGVNVGLYLNKNFFYKPALSDMKPAGVGSEAEPAGSATVVMPVSVPDTAIVLSADSLVVAGESAPPEEKKPEILGKIKIEAGSRLTLISLEYYGSKLFWVYIYEFNKSVIKDPNNVPIGTELEIPAPEIYGIDAHSRLSLDKAAARQTEILSGKL